MTDAFPVAHEPAKYCACGAQWHGRTVDRAQDIIALHRRRGGSCWMMSHGAFKHAHRCMCEQCRAERGAAWKAKRALRSGSSEPHQNVQP